MDGWIDGWMDGWIDGQMDVQIKREGYRWVGGWVCGQAERKRNGQTIDGSLLKKEECMSGWMVVWMNE